MVENRQSNAAIIVADRYLPPKASISVPEEALNKWLSRGGSRFVSSGSLVITDAPSRLTVAAPAGVTLQLPELPTEQEAPALDTVDEEVSVETTEPGEVALSDNAAVEAVEVLTDDSVVEDETVESDKSSGRRRRGR